MPEQDYYMAIKEDAVKVSSILGTTLTKSNGYEMTGFEKSNCDNYIKRLLHAKHSVLIAEPLKFQFQKGTIKSIPSYQKKPFKL